MPRQASQSDAPFDLSNHPRCNERLRQFQRCLRELLDDIMPTPNKIRRRQLAEKYPALPDWLLSLAFMLAYGRQRGRPRRKS